MAGWVGRLVEVLGVTRPVVAGHSMGGAVALAYVLSSAERVAGLGLVGTAADLALPAGFRELVERRYEEFVSHFTGMALPRGTPAARVGSHQPIFPQADKETVQGDFRAVHGFNVVDRLGEVRVPTVVVGGEADVLTPPRASRLLAAGIPGARLVMVPAAGHLLPREDARAVAEALNGLRPPTA
jgi:pimeloyl-ACP methyl ester carboxylesterase